MKKETIDQLVIKYKKRGRVFPHALTYLNDKYFFVYKQFDNKNFCVVATNKVRSCESVLGLFKTRITAIEFGVELKLKEVKAPVI